MRNLYFSILAIALTLATIGCQPNKTEAELPERTDGHPTWIMQGNIYEVNIRQYTPEGTLNAFAKHLDRLQKMGVQTIWFMPINPISKVDRKGSLGSYYAVSDYCKINPEFGTLADFKNVVKAIHDRGMKVIIDWVPNHTGADHAWLKNHPDFYVQGKDGKAAVAFDWADVRQLNFKNPVMQDSMINAMKYWVKETDIDGFRCDVAWNVPAGFWKKSIPQLKKMKNMFFLAEGDSTYLPKSGFDAVYGWHMFKMMEKIAKGDRPAFGLDSIVAENAKMYPKNTIQLYFTSNHDENSWNHADFGTFPKEVHAPFAVFTQTMQNGVPLVYSGQEEPVLRALKFFDKDPMSFKELKRAAFYTTLQDLRKNCKALAANAAFAKVKTGDPKAVYAYTREKDGAKILVLLNFSKTPQNLQLSDPKLHGKVTDIFTQKTLEIDAKTRTLPAWGYAVYRYN